MSGQYSGNRSLDAEIVLDFQSGNLIMDYSKNHLADPRDSSCSAFLDKGELRTAPLKTQLVWAAISAYFGMLIVIPYTLYIKYFTFWATFHGVSAQGQYDHQELIRYVNFIFRGTAEASKTGCLWDHEVVFNIPNNIWWEYELEGEYQEKIASIALVRNFITYYRFGRFKSIRQNGWKVIFRFKELPQSGSCVIRYIL